MILRTPMITQSVGVPCTAKWRGPISRSRSGLLSDSEWATPDWSVSGATTKTSSDSSLRDRLQNLQARRVDAVVIGEQDAHGIASPARRGFEAPSCSARLRFARTTMAVERAD